MQLFAPKRESAHVLPAAVPVTAFVHPAAACSAAAPACSSTLAGVLLLLLDARAEACRGVLCSSARLLLNASCRWGVVELALGCGVPQNVLCSSAPARARRGVSCSSHFGI